MISRLHLTLLFVALLCIVPLVGHAVERHALVIGNSAYTPFALVTPTNDANDMAAQLQAMDYKLFTNGPMIDLDRLSIERAIDEFAQSLPLGANAVFYFAGHGMANDRDSYLLPVNSGLEFQSELRLRTIGLRSLVDTLKTYNPDGTNVLLLDANRDNSLSHKFLGVKNGLQKMQDVPEGVFIAYAAESGQLSAENLTSRNSNYTRQLINTMATQSGLSIRAMHEQVANTIFDQTKGAQLPVSEDHIYGNWCFIECGSSSLAQARSQAVSEKPLTKLKVKPTRNYWKIAGGVALGIAVLAITNSGDDNGSTPIAVSLNPPGQ